MTRAEAEIWTHSGLPDYYENHRRSTGDLYESEWFFLRDLLREEISILDVGCAVGGFVPIIGEHVRNFRYTGVDISAEMVARARHRHPEHRFHVVEPGNFEPIRGQQFDLVLCLGVLHLTNTWRELLGEAWRVTRHTLLVDFRETDGPTVENDSQSYLKMNFRGDEQELADERLPYNVINMSELTSIVQRICAGAVSLRRYGYLAPPSSAAVTPVSRLFMTTYRLDKTKP